jgi:multicomponent Na+:H+ antiporter subunit D
MSLETILVLTLITPLVGGIGISICSSHPNLRESITLLTGIILFLLVTSLLNAVLNGNMPSIKFFDIIPGLPLQLTIEPLGMLFACVASGLWIINSLYSIGYMRCNNEPNQTKFYICFTIAISSSMGIAFAGNMFTLFIFYELLTLSTYPLVTHKGNAEAKSGGRVYLGLLIGTSIGFQLIAIIWTWFLTGTLDFTPEGILSGKIDPTLLPFLLALYMFGIGKAALMPFHSWLPAAMVAPTPVSALLHAVAVVKAGVFTILKVVVYIFGIDFLSTTGASTWLIWVASFTVIVSSLIALSKDNLKLRLAYSTVSQLSYIVLAAALASKLSILGAGLHIATHALGKITLFMCAGAIYLATRKTEISDMDGLGRVMPFTFIAFAIGAFSIIGLPPFGGIWSKWYMALGAANLELFLVVAVYMVSSLLNVGYLLPVVARGFFKPLPQEWQPSGSKRFREAPLLCVIPLCATALGCFILFFFADKVLDLLRPIVN